MGEIPEDIARAAVNAIDEMDQPTGLSRVEIVENYILAERNRSAWQPIETAPKDGTAILTYRPYEKDDPIDVTVWTADEWGNIRWCYNLGDYGGKPTHWMPLPPHPTPSTEKERAAS